MLSSLEVYDDLRDPFPVVGTTTSPATNVTVNGDATMLFADSTFASTFPADDERANDYAPLRPGQKLKCKLPLAKVTKKAA